jgi:ribosomal protein L11 methyltransferase
VPSSWLQLFLRVPPSALDAVSNFLIERGSPGVVIKKDEVQAFFAQSHRDSLVKRDIRRFLRGIRTIYPGLRERELRWKVLQERNWNKSWRRFFTARKVGKRFWVAPPWGDPPQTRRRIVLTIEPGMAFGTGTHATTRGCLEFLEEVAELLKEREFQALDVGTGSGILAIALAQLGAEKVLALDNDPVALKAARINLRRNGVQGRVLLTRSRLTQVKGSFPLVVANLTAETIVGLADRLGMKVSPNGYLILSGILKPKVKEVLRSLSSTPFKLVNRKHEKEWATLLLRKS